MSLLAIESTYEECGKFEICKNPVFENTGACALHCLDEKIENTDSYLSDFSNLFMSYLFEKIKNINSIESINDYQKNIKTTALSSLRLEGLYSDIFNDNNDIKSVINDSDLLIENIFFPKNINSYIIKEFKKVFFKNCIFRENITFDKSYIFYSSCTFYENIEIKADTEYLYTKDKKDISYSPIISSPNEDEYKYKECVFKNDVNITGQKKINYIYYRLFRNCDFKKNINIDNIKVRSDFIAISDVFEYIKIIDGKYDYKDLICKYKNIYSFNDLSIKNCNFDSSFKINGIDIDYIEKNQKNMDDYNKSLSNEIKGIFSINSLIIEDTKFDEKFELKNCTVNNVNFEDSNVKGIFDVYKSSFIKARFYKSIFEEFAAFEYVIFGDSLIENKTDFIYVTFKDFSNFRDTNFKSGLNFSRANLKQEPNFLNVEVNTEYTDRETLRIIKNSFEKVNNKIEANKFFISEMKYYKRNIKNDIVDKIPFFYHAKTILLVIILAIILFIFIKMWMASLAIFLLLFIVTLIACVFLDGFSSYFVLCANYYISRFGESYIQPFIIFLFSIGVYTYILKIHEYIFGEESIARYAVSLRSFVTQNWFISLSEFLNACAANVPLFSKALEKKSGIEFISLLFFIWFGILTWQIIIAVKRNTQH